MPAPQDNKEDRIKRVIALLPRLEDSQIGWVEEIAKQLTRPHTFERDPTSDFMSECMLEEIGDGIRLHHCFSKAAFAKDKFEFLMERAASLCGVQAEMAPRGNPGYDIIINGETFSLKTQADKSINRGYIWLSKFMELGKGQWSDKDDDLIGLRDKFLNHMKSYQRIMVLRTLSRAPKDWEYELVEIPKALLERSASGRLEMTHSSRQMPKPGYCYVSDDLGNLMYKLYFDAGSERKLQIKAIDISNCVIHGRWRFPPEELVAEA